MTDTAPDPNDIAQASERIARVRSGLVGLFVGQDALVEHLLASVLAGGHVLVESPPGLGKTILVRALARLLGLSSGRIQFTPDLMPSDITGSHIFDLGERQFVFRPGPIFCQFLLADELNRSPAKTHAALLEAMAERHVTLDGKRYPLAAPFLVMATQNPIENEGTYALPEAQLDRFLFKLVIDYPAQADEERILAMHTRGASVEAAVGQLDAVMDASGLTALQALAARVAVADSVIAYIVACVRRTRAHPGLHAGASPRAGLAMLAAARALALMRGRAFVIPDDVRDAALPALRHRVILSAESEVERRTADTILAGLLDEVEVPRGQTAAG